MSAGVVRFGRFEVRPDTREIRDTGVPARLGPRAFDLLLALIERRDRVVGKDELLDLVWPGVVVEENNLQVQISALRKLLGAQAVATIPGRGYRFTAALEESEAKPAAESLAAVPGHDPPSIAVLPFVNLSADSEQDYFADGITEDIITDLSRWRSLAVTSRNSTFRFKGKPVDVREIGRELGVRYVVEGSVRRMGERIRVTAQLVDAETGNHVWSERFDRPAAEIFSVQDEVVQTIVGTLVGRVHASGADRARRKAPSSLAAYELMLRGNALSWDNPIEGPEARHAFERAIELDPGYGLAHALLAVQLSREWANDLSGSRESLDRALALAQRGVELDEGESTCHAILGQIYLDRRSFDLALRHMERGVEINPANQWNRADLGTVLAYIGRPEEGLAMLESARRADPYFGPPWYWRAKGVAQFALRRHAEALADFDRVGASAPLWALALMAACCAKLGLAERTRELVARCLARAPGANVGKLCAKIAFREGADREHVAECLRVAGFPE